MLRIRCIPVAHGDSLLIEYGKEEGALHRVLVDGGPVRCFESVRSVLDEIPADERRAFELFVVTHIDTDHIDGAIVLLRDEELGFAAKDVWFNGWPQIGPLTEREGTFDAKQGEMLGALLTEQERPWNVAFDGGPVEIPAAPDPLPTVTLDGGATLTLLGPTRDRLLRLRKNWLKTLKEVDQEPGDWKDALERLEKRKEYVPPVREDTFAGSKTFASDKAPANGSSIAMILEYDGTRVLLGGDAFAPDLCAAVGRLPEDAGDIHAVKLPHHGSMANVSAELLELTGRRHFLVSTNGAYFDHPDPETIELLGQDSSEPVKVSFNHLADTTKRWQDEDAQAEDNIVAIYPPEGGVASWP